jgi:hypothetical protein
MRYSARRVVAAHGYRSVMSHFRRHRPRYARLLARHGIGLAPVSRNGDLPGPLPYRSMVARSLSGSLDRLRSKLGGSGAP